jgi:homoserine acetyltransferase
LLCRYSTGKQSLPYFAVESYLQYQGKKFIQRFDANCDIQLTYTLDSHDVARGRGEYVDVLRRGAVQVELWRSTIRTACVGD